MNEHDDEECTCIPENAIITNVLHLIEYMDEDGELWYSNQSCSGDGSEINSAKMYEMVGRAQMMAMAPDIASMVIGYMEQDEDGD